MKKMLVMMISTPLLTSSCVTLNEGVSQEYYYDEEQINDPEYHLDQSFDSVIDADNAINDGTLHPDHVFGEEGRPELEEGWINDENYFPGLDDGFGFGFDENMPNNDPDFHPEIGYDEIREPGGTVNDPNRYPEIGYEDPESN